MIGLTPEPVKKGSIVVGLLSLDIGIEGVGRGCVDSERSSMLGGIENE